MPTVVQEKYNTPGQCVFTSCGHAKAAGYVVYQSNRPRLKGQRRDFCSAHLAQVLKRFPHYKDIVTYL